jgi:peptide/nickel transport system ATP-binding protein
MKLLAANRRSTRLTRRAGLPRCRQAREIGLSDASDEPLLSLSALRTEFPGAGGAYAVVDGVSLDLARGQTLAVVGESGCGKSILSLSIMRLVPKPGRIVAGRAIFDGVDLLTLPEGEMRGLRGRRIGMVFQEPMTSLNPSYTVGDQIVEAMAAHDKRAPASELRRRAVAALDRVRIPAASRRVEDYPHQMSGGMRQRAMIAMALSSNPDLLIADEPTTALDVTVQAQILDLLRELQRESGMAMLLITHDLGVVAEAADRVAVMYAGRIVEQAAVAALFDDPLHPYTLGLLGSIPRLDDESDRLLAIEGAVPPPSALPLGCRFNPRCVFAAEECRAVSPALRAVGEAHAVACHRAPVEAWA